MAASCSALVAGGQGEEMEHHGTPFQRRWQVLRERVEAMKAIWTPGRGVVRRGVRHL